MGREASKALPACGLEAGSRAGAATPSGGRLGVNPPASEEAHYCLQATVDLELPEEVLDMGPDGIERQLQLRGDRLGGLPGDTLR